ncbi:unnamed protein product [Rotaria sordida]|uniref:Uncharacterized protein n=2 Tax=Rotaria sordida TaxID=392033 RepID=A0A814M0P8_9BILA|nr:unnamed protein product [Rotaria sordida]
MGDKQPLLNVSSKFCIDDDNGSKKQLFTNSFSDWRRCFSRKGNDNKYVKLEDDAEHSDKDEAVGIFRLVTGMFVTESFDHNCHYQHQNSTPTTKNNNTYSQVIRLNLFNNDPSYKVRHEVDVILSSTLTTSMTSFREKVINIVHWLFIISAVQFLTCLIENLIWTISIKRQTFRMSVSLFRSIVQRRIPYMDTKRSSQLNAKLFDNIEKIEKGIGFEFLILMAMLPRIIGCLLTSFIVNWQLALIMLCLMPLIIGSSLVFSKLTAKEAMNELMTYSKAGQIVQEVFSSLRTVLSLNGSKFEQKRYDRELYPTCWSSIRKGAVFGIYTGWLSLITYLIYSIGFIFGSLLVSYKDDHTSNISDILVIVSIFAQCLGYLSGIGPFFQSFSEARGAAASVFRLIDEGNDASVNEIDIWKEDTEAIYNINGDIEFDNINFSYPSRRDIPVLRNLSLIARAGQTTALVGSSGCGKSTCISLFLRYYEPSSGRIMIDGRLITDYHVQQLRQNIGVVSQEPILFGMSIYENIRFGNVNATQAEIEQAAREANAHDFIMQLPDKYETLVGERGIQLSGGEKQRIALARALVKQSTFLLLDEATSALDNVSEKIVQEALDRACKGRTTIVIAHRLTTIQNAHQIYVLDNGSVIEQGTHETLMAKEGGKYQTMVKHQQMERINDDQDDMTSTQKVTEEDEKSIFECSRSLSDGQIVDVNKQSSKLFRRRFVFLRLLSMSSPEWITILIGCIACVLNGVAQPLFAFLLTKIVEAFKYCSTSERRRYVLITSRLFLLLGGLVWILRFFQYTAFAIAGSKLTQRIRSKAFACLLRQEIAYFDRPENSSGAICARLSSDASAVQGMAGARLGAICEALALSFFGILFGCFISWQLTLIVFGPLFCYFLVIYGEMRLRLQVIQQSGCIIGRASMFIKNSFCLLLLQLVVEAIHNIRTVKQLSIEKEVLRQYSKLMHEVFILSWKPSIVNSILYGICWSLDVCTMAFVYWRALVLFEKNELAANRVIMVFAFAILSMRALRLIGMLSRHITASVSAAKTFFDLFDRKPAIDNTSNEGQELVDFRGEIKFDQVKFIYPARPTSIILNKFKLNIKASQRVALVGASGCGKSTIIQLLERFYDVTSGRIFIDGIDIRQLNLDWVRSQFGLVSQEPILFDLTIAENISYGLENVPMEVIINAARKANIHQFIEQLPQGYETKVGMKGNFLSGGEKQRIAIARVLLRRPKVLLLDEATSAMDSHNEQSVQETLEQAQTEDSSRTSLIIAHRLSTIRSCDLICVLDRGHIVESGTHTELIQKHGAYYKMLVQNNLQ